jgi:hypothetical protein
MKRCFYSLFAVSALTVMGLTLAGCAQQPAASAAPAAAPAQPTTVIENVHRDHDDGDARSQPNRDHAQVQVDIHAQIPDKDHPRPDDAR